MPSTPRYTIVYTGSETADEAIVFILTSGFGAWGNFPGSPTSRQQTSVRGNPAEILTTVNFDPRRPGLSALMLSWREQGFDYSIRATSTGRVTDDDLQRIAQGLTALP